MDKPDCFDRRKYSAECEDVACRWFSGCDAKNEATLCAECSGSGEGRTDGTLCPPCRGRGTEQ